MKAYIVVVIVSFVLGGFVGGELTGKQFLLTGAVLGAVIVGGGLFALGGFFSWRDEKKLRLTKQKITPEMRAVFDRMTEFASSANVQTLTKQEPENDVSNDSKVESHRTFYLPIEVILKAQLLPKFSEIKNSFPDIMTNKVAAGYVFGAHDGLLQVLDMRVNLDITRDLVLKSYQRLFGKQAGFALYNMSISIESNPDFQKGRKEGGDEIFEYVEKGTMPLGLTRILFLKSNNNSSSDSPTSTIKDENFAEFNNLIFKLHNLFRANITIAKPEDTFDTVLQRSSIYTHVSPLAYALILLNKSVAEPDFLVTDEHVGLRNKIISQMTKNRLEVSSLMLKAYGNDAVRSVMTPDKNGIQQQVQKELDDVLAVISYQSTFRDKNNVTTNLVADFFKSAPYYKGCSNPQKAVLAFNSFAEDYVSQIKN